MFLNGCLLNNLEKKGRRGNTAVVLCIEDTCGNFGSCLPTLSKAIQVIKVNFVRAVVAAGLPKGESFFCIIYTMNQLALPILDIC